MMATQPGHYIHHCWRYNQDPRLWAPAPVAVIYARKFGIAAMRWLPVRDAKRASIISLLIECNASGDPKQIRKTVNRGRLHAGINHNPNFIRCACRHRHLSLAAKTLTLAAIVKCREVEALPKIGGPRHALAAAHAADAGPNRRPTFVRPSPRFTQRDLSGLSGLALSAPRPAQASRWSRPPSSRAPR